MSYDYNYCRRMLETITDMVDGIADVKSYDEPARGAYTIMCLFRYPIGTAVEIDEYYNGIQAALGVDWALKLSAEQANDGTVIAKLAARLKNGYGNGK